MIEYTFKARTLERSFMRKVKKQPVFFTVKGKVNTVSSYSKDSISFTTSTGGKTHNLSRKKLRQAIKYVYFNRTATRNDLEQYSPFTSALLAMLVKCFKELAIIQKLKHGLYRLSLKGCRFFFGGCEQAPKDMEMVANEGGRFVLLNYHKLRNQKYKIFLHHLERLQLYAVIDSGAFSFFNEKEKEQQLELFPSDPLEEYAYFINEIKDHPSILGFFSLDVIGNPSATKENYKRLKRMTNATIYPVWQVADSFEELDKMVAEGHELIGIGGTVPMLLRNQIKKVKKIFDQVFNHHYNGQPFHWLGGANHLLCEYPFFSSDSTSWLNPRKNGERKVYNEKGYKVIAPMKMNMKEIMQQHIKFLSNLEKSHETQLCLF